MSQAEKNIVFLETQVPATSGAVFANARVETLASGQSVLSTDQGVIYRVAPDGTREAVKKIDLPIPVTRGTKVRLK